MTPSEWDDSSDVRALFQAFPAPATDRKVRLWGAACGRIMMAPAQPTPEYEHYREWLADPSWMEVIEAAEDFADARISRAELRARRASRGVSGGPYNVYHAIAAATQFTQDRLIGTIIRDFAEEFGLPTMVEMTGLFRDIFGNPFRPVAFDPSWRTEAVVALARAMYESRDFAPMPVLADALDDAGCDHADFLAHCRGSGPHVRGCCVVDLVLGKA